MNAQPRQDLVTLEIDGRTVEAPGGAMIIEVADRIGIDIPRFCYHRKLSIAANCRMCLVDVEKAPKPLPACATPVAEGMKVYTESRRARDAQRNVMEFLLINHPLDCPICDQGGECELQDLAMGYGRSVSRFVERKRSVADQDIGPLIETEMTRCIHCTRCVRFLGEIAGTNELGAIGRGEDMRISTYIKHSIESELSGNIIDLCPVGALTDKPFRYRARSWEMLARPGLALHDCVHSNLWYHLLRGRILRVVPRDNDAVNETWIADRDRYSHWGLYHAARLLEPEQRSDGRWRTVDWRTALEQAAAALRASGDALQVLLSPHLVCEEHLAYQCFAGALNGRADERLYTESDRAIAHAASGVPLAALADADAVLLAGARIHHDQPLLAHRLRQAGRRGARISSLGARSYDWSCDQSETLLARPDEWLRELAAILRAAAPQAAGQAGLKTLLKTAKPEARHERIARELADSEHGVVIAGQQIGMHPQADALQYLLHLIAEATGCELVLLAAGGNSAGARLMRERTGRQTPPALAALTKEPPRVLLLHSIDPLADTTRPDLLRQACAAANTVIALTGFATPALRELADILLPVADMRETGGTAVNLEGRVQRFPGAATVPGSARPGWKIARKLTEMLDPGNELAASILEWRDDGDPARSVAGILDDQADNSPPKPDKPKRLSAVRSSAGRDRLYRFSELPLTGVDLLCRHSKPLQDSPHGLDDDTVHVHPGDLERLGLGAGQRVLVIQGEQRAEAVVAACDALAPGCVYLPMATKLSAQLGAAFGPIAIEPAEQAA